VPVVFGPQRAGDPPELVGDANRIKSELGWTPKHADLADIIETAWNWHQGKKWGSK
jgi:UDP-glucose 4-epimerase